MSTPCAEQTSVLQKLKQLSDNTPQAYAISIRGFELKVKAHDPGIASWLESFVAPLRSDQHPAKRSFTLSVVYADPLLSELVTWHDHEQAAGRSYSYGRRHELFSRICVSDLLTVDYYPALGTAWVTDLETNQVAMIVGSRAALVPVELGRGVVELLSRHLRDDGWSTFHSGAVQVDGRNWMIVGDSGTGKTSLILGLMSHGGRYLSNERLWVRVGSDGQLQIECFPQAMGIGLGTAESIPQLEPFIDRPDLLTFPQHKFDAERVWSTDPTKRRLLPDKLKLLASEATREVGTQPASLERSLAGVLVPQLEVGAAITSPLAPIDEQTVGDILGRNQIQLATDDIYPAWLPLGFGLEEPDVLEALAVLRKIPRKVVRFGGAVECGAVLDALVAWSS